MECSKKNNWNTTSKSETNPNSTRNFKIQHRTDSMECFVPIFRWPLLDTTVSISHNGFYIMYSNDKNEKNNNRPQKLPCRRHSSDIPCWKWSSHVPDCARVVLFHLSGRSLVPWVAERTPHFHSITKSWEQSNTWLNPFKVSTRLPDMERHRIHKETCVRAMELMNRQKRTDRQWARERERERKRVGSTLPNC